MGCAVASWFAHAVGVVVAGVLCAFDALLAKCALEKKQLKAGQVRCGRMEAAFSTDGGVFCVMP